MDRAGGELSGHGRSPTPGPFHNFHLIPSGFLTYKGAT